MSDEESDDRARQLLLARFGTCGSRIATHPDAGLLQLVALLPARPKTDEQVSIPIEMSLRNLTAAVVRVSTYRSGARLAVTQDGVVVASASGVRPVGTEYTIQPGAAHAFTSNLNLIACDTNSVLPPGDYQVHALQPFTLLDHDLNRGPTINVYGGPWDIALR